MTKRRPDFNDIVCVIVLFMGVGLALWMIIMFKENMSHHKKVDLTAALVKSEAELRVAIWDGMDREIEPKRDAWKSVMQYEMEVYPHKVKSVVTSPGPDGTFGNDDDIVGEATDFNKSRIIGEWMARKSKEAAKGFVEGLKAKSKFRSD